MAERRYFVYMYVLGGGHGRGMMTTPMGDPEPTREEVLRMSGLSSSQRVDFLLIAETTSEIFLAATAQAADRPGVWFLPLPPNVNQ